MLQNIFISPAQTDLMAIYFLTFLRFLNSIGPSLWTPNIRMQNKNQRNIPLKMHIHYLFSIFALFFSWGQCYLQYVPRTDKCVQSSPAIGNSEFCCSAFCIDGTIAGRPGQCLNYTDPCKDVDGPPSCGAGRTYAGVKRDWVDVGGVCPFTRACPSQKFSWTWTCCDCPAGYVSFNHGACVLYPSLYSCVGCTDPKELLTGDAVNGFKCILRLSSSTTSKSSTRTSSQSSTRTTMTSSTRAPTCTTAAGKNPFDCWSCNKSQYDACPNTVNYKCTAGVNKGFTTKCPKTCLDVSVAIPSTCKTIPQRPSCYVSQAGIDFLKKEEMFCSTFYNQGDNVKTIGGSRLLSFLKEIYC